MDLEKIEKSWDLVIIGGGITGAGILREASRMGLQVLLVEQKDFAWGTSSRSSKLVHGGLRYLKEGKVFLTKIAVEEREFLLQDAPGLVEPLDFLLPVYEDQRPGKRLLKIGLSLYDLLARERQHRFYDPVEFYKRTPLVKRKGLIGGFHYTDAQVDDCRLVLRLLHESKKAGSTALNYTTVTEILRNDQGDVTGVRLRDTETHLTQKLTTRAVINATGCWAEKLHPSPDPHKHLRPLRGSHLVFPSGALPLTEGFGFIHPLDQRSVFVIPWEGAVLVGTTDLDHQQDLNLEPAISDTEISYLIEGVNAIFPSLDLTMEKCIAAFAGIRPVLSEKERPPSEESREHVVWVDQGLVTVTGGKLTTFRRLAWDALKAAKPFLPPVALPARDDPVFAKVPQASGNDYGLSETIWRRLYGRYGDAAHPMIQGAVPEDLTLIPGTLTLWAELAYAARHEQIRHLDDLLLRRVRIGLLTPFGGKPYFKRIQKICRDIVPWDKRRWKTEINRYTDLWHHAHALPIHRKKQTAKRIFGASKFDHTVLDTIGSWWASWKPKRK